MKTEARFRRSLTVVHSSDLHVDTDWTARTHGGDGTRGLRGVLETASAIDADLIVLAGDVFDHNRLPLETLARTARLLAEAGRPVAILPGNHDPAVPESGWHRGNFVDHANVHILGLTRPNAVVFPDLDLEVCGTPHRDYDDMVPMKRRSSRRARWRIVLAHGHYQPVRDRAVPYHPGWLIHDRHLTAADADYIALGHWNRSAKVGPKSTRAYYSGSPELTGTVNVVRLKESGTVSVRAEPIRWSAIATVDG